MIYTDKKLISKLKQIVHYDLIMLLARDGWNSKIINKHPPIIHRLAFKLSDDYTIFLHKIFNTEGEKALIHSHSWPFAVKILKGGYEMGIGLSADRNQPPEPLFTTMLPEGSIYAMTNPNIWHYTKPFINQKTSYSVMIVGERYREARSENNDILSTVEVGEMKQQFAELIYEFKNPFK